MRKLIMWNVMTLDGFIAGPGEDISWHELIWSEELEKLSEEQGAVAGGLVFGRKTYEMMAAYWPNAEEPDFTSDYMNRLPKYVFAHHLTKSDWNNVSFFSGDAAKEIAALKAQDGKDLFLFGSADLAAQLLPHKLIDELRIGITPFAIGGGTPLFKSAADRTMLKLLRTDTTQRGLMIARYAPA